MAAETVALFNANDGLTGRDGGPYLDQIEAEKAEIERARVEHRKPDLVNPPASAGIVLVTAKQAVSNAGVNNVPSQDDTNVEDTALRAVAKDKDNSLRVYGEREVPEEVEDDNVLGPTDVLDPNPNDPDAKDHGQVTPNSADADKDAKGSK